MNLLLFTTDVGFAVRCQTAGIDGVIVDWETVGKERRQAGHDLEKNNDSAEDVARLAAALDIPVTVRINRYGGSTAEEIQCALDHGARCIMLPMAQSAKEVGCFLKMLDGRARSLVQIETRALAEDLGEFSELSWDSSYIGLNDLMISYGNRSIWQAVADGTVEQICSALQGREYGFGGITCLGCGVPIRFELILHELTRMGCSLSLLRRSFKRDVAGRDVSAELAAIRALIDCSRKRGIEAIQSDRERLLTEIG